MNRLFYVALLVFLFQHGQGMKTSEKGSGSSGGFSNVLENVLETAESSQPKDTTYTEIEFPKTVDYAEPLEFLRTLHTFRLPPKQRDAEMDIGKYCSLEEVHEQLWNVVGYACVVKVEEDPDIKQCKYEIFPKAIRKRLPCGVGGHRYTLQYDVCLLDEFNEIVVDRVYPPIFEICYNRNKKQSLYTVHQIASNDLIKLPKPQDYIKLLQKSITIMGEKIMFEDIANEYESILSQYEENPDHPDYLIPQLLVPITDLDPSFARRSNLNYFVVRPQYNRLNDTWNGMNLILWKKFHNSELKIKMSTGTARNEEVIPINKLLQIEIPTLWWRAVTISDADPKSTFHFVIVFHNVVSTFDKAKIDYVCPKDENAQTETLRYCIEIQEELKNPNALVIECCLATSEVKNVLGFDQPLQKSRSALLERYLSPSSSVKSDSDVEDQI